MASRTVRIASAAHLYTPPADGVLLQGSIGDWRVYETVDSDLDPLSRRPGLVRYRIVLEYDAESAEQAHEQYTVGLYIAERLERLWLYAGMTPLSGKYLGSTIELAAPPPRWETNYESVYRELAGVQFQLQVNRVDRWSPPAWPLAQALAAFVAYQEAGADLQKLIELHYGAHTAVGIHGQALGFARALELLSALLAVQENGKPERGVPEFVRECMTRSLDWLQKMSNWRFDTRHVWGRSERQILEPMTSDEHADFIDNADVLLRGCIASRLGVTFMVSRIPAA